MSRLSLVPPSPPHAMVMVPRPPPVGWVGGWAWGGIVRAMFHIPYFIFHIPYSIFHIPYSIFHVPNSIFHVPYSIMMLFSMLAFGSLGDYLSDAYLCLQSTRLPYVA